jgi:hypothetical protein
LVISFLELPTSLSAVLILTLDSFPWFYEAVCHPTDCPPLLSLVPGWTCRRGQRRPGDCRPADRFGQPGRLRDGHELTLPFC